MALLLTRAAAPARQPRRTRPPGCRHCGSPLPGPAEEASGFCCPGCAYVNRLVEAQGLDAYYRFKDPVTAPVDRAVFEPRDYAWLEEMARAAEAAADPARLDLDLQGVSCAACIWLIEKSSAREPGVVDTRVDSTAGTLRLRFSRGAFDAAAWARRLQSLGYLVGPPGERTEQAESPDLSRRIGLAGFFTLNVMLFTFPSYFGMSRDFAYAGLFRLLALLFATLSVLSCGSYFFRRAVAALRARSLHIDLPIALGIGGAYLGSLWSWFAGRDVGSYFDFVATFILLMLTGRWVQVRAVERNRRRLLRRQPPPPTLRLREGGTVARERISAGQTIAVGPGQTVPVECRLVSGSATFSLASVNGEAEPRLAEAGGRVPAGAINLGRIEAWLETVEPWGASLLARLLAAPSRPADRSQGLERIVGGYVAAILVLSAAAGLGWWVIRGDAVRAGTVAISVLVVTCPCAIGLALPLLEETAASAALQRGVYVREGTVWARLGRVRKIVFDKTGTLTLESPLLVNPEVLGALDPEAKAALAALVRGSLHPVSQCLWESLLAHQGDVAPAPGNVAEEPGFGVRLGAWSLGRAGWADDGPPGPDTVLAHSGAAAARFQFADVPRPNAEGELRRLGERGYEIYILSGDGAANVAALAAQLGVPTTRALGGMSPEEKADWVDAGGANQVLVLGDGANDSLAFDRALCRGTPLIHRGLLESKADFYYLRRGIEGVRSLLDIDRIRRRTQTSLVVFSVAYNVVAAGLAAAGWVTPVAAAILMPSSSLASIALVGLGRRSMAAAT